MNFFPYSEPDFNFNVTKRTQNAFDCIYILRLNLIDYMNTAKIWIMRQADGNALILEKRDGNG